MTGPKFQSHSKAQLGTRVCLHHTISLHHTASYRAMTEEDNEIASCFSPSNTVRLPVIFLYDVAFLIF